MWRWNFDLLDAAALRPAALVSAGMSGAVSWVGQDVALAVFGVPFAVLVAGFAGALIAVAVMPPIARWWISLSAGTGISAYTTSAALLWIHTYPQLHEIDGRAVAFSIGLVAYFVLSLFFRDGREIILGWLRARLGIAPKPEDRS